MAKHFEKDKKKSIITVFQIFFTLLLIVSLIAIIKWVIENRKNNNINEELSQAITLVDQETFNYNVDFKMLKEKNSDTIGWLKVNGTNVEYAVVQTDNNSFYLNHDFEKNYNQAGWIFADYRNKFDGNDKNIVIYGHNRRNDSMFGTLNNILEEEWYNNEENTKVNFITEDENCIYEVFSVYQIESEDYYLTTEFTEKEFSKYIETITKRSVKDFNVEVTNKDSIITLSTCSNNSQYRIVLHAKKINN